MKILLGCQSFVVSVVDHIVERGLYMAHEKIKVLDHHIRWHCSKVKNKCDEFRRHASPMGDQVFANRLDRPH